MDLMAGAAHQVFLFAENGRIRWSQCDRHGSCVYRSERNMNINHISFKGDLAAKAVRISEETDLSKAMQELQIRHPGTVIVLVGGASGIRSEDESPMRKAVEIVARLAEETQSVVIDGGTQAGIMTEIGKQRKQNRYSFPLIGVVVDSLLTDQEPQSMLEPNHTHFFLVPGKDWGDESSWISKIATSLAGDRKSITILVNGGRISRTDVEYSLVENRPTFVMRGTGRLADEITLTGKLFAIDVSQKPEEIIEFLKSRLS